MLQLKQLLSIVCRTKCQVHFLTKNAPALAAVIDLRLHSVSDLSRPYSQVMINSLLHKVKNNKPSSKSSSSRTNMSSADSPGPVGTGNSGENSSSGQDSDDDTPTLATSKVEVKKKAMAMHSTRNATIMKEKERYLLMSLEERRKLYKCGDRFATLSSEVLTWENYFLLQRPRLEKLKKKGSNNIQRYQKAEVNESLNKKVSIWAGDITRLEIDGIVNAANNSLLGGGGVDGAIHRAAGSSLKAECVTLNGCDTGDAKITCGYKLPAKYVLHTVGPIGEQKKMLKSCYATCLQIVKDNELKSVAFPCISTGIYGYPADAAAPLAIGTVRNWLETSGYADQVDRVIFCLFLKADIALYETLMQVFFPVEVKEQQGDDEDEGMEEKTIKEQDESVPKKKEKTMEISEKDGKAKVKPGENGKGDVKTKEDVVKDELKRKEDNMETDDLPHLPSPPHSDPESDAGDVNDGEQKMETNTPLTEKLEKAESSSPKHTEMTTKSEVEVGQEDVERKKSVNSSQKSIEGKKDKAVCSSEKKNESAKPQQASGKL